MKGQCLSEYVYKSSAEKRNCCCRMYVTFGHCISVHCLFVDDSSLCFTASFLCFYLYQILNLRTHGSGDDEMIQDKNADHLLLS